MAIEFARIQYVKRSEGRNAVAAAAYQARELIVDQNGERHDGRKQGPIDKHMIMLPEGADERFQSMQHLWQEAERAEHRKNSQTAKLMLLGLPRELSGDQRIELAASFIHKHFVSRGIAAQLDFHPPHRNDENFHCHIEMTTRRLEGDRFASHKARDLEPAIRNGRHGTFVSEAKQWNQLWRDHQVEYFKEHKLDIVVDPQSIFSLNRHFGPRRSWTPSVRNIVDRRRELNDALARHPALIYEALRRTHQHFDERALNRFLDKHRVIDLAERARINGAIAQLRREEMSRNGGAMATSDTSDQRPAMLDQEKRAREPEMTDREWNSYVKKVDLEAGVAAKAWESEQRKRPQRQRATPADALYARYKAERAIAIGNRKEAEQRIYDRWGAYQRDLSGFYDLRREQEKLNAKQPSRVDRMNAHELLRAEQHGDRVAATRDRTMQLAKVRSEHPIPTWESFLEREGQRGDKEAARLIQQKIHTKEMQRGHER